MTSRPIRSAVVPVAGRGTRLLPATRAQPKEMLAVLDKPVIGYVVDELRAAGIDRVLLAIVRGKGSIEDHFDTEAEGIAVLSTSARARSARARTSRALAARCSGFTRGKSS
ncbi:hypothetical protein BH20ACT18_BH20ACT18_00230 [soil metagenome]